LVQPALFAYQLCRPVIPVQHELDANWVGSDWQVKGFYDFCLVSAKKKTTEILASPE